MPRVTRGAWANPLSDTMTNETSKKNNSRARTKGLIVGSIGLLTLFVLAAPAASASDLVSTSDADECNGVVEIEGCTYTRGATTYYCSVWVGAPAGGTCVVG